MRRTVIHDPIDQTLTVRGAPGHIADRVPDTTAADAALRSAGATRATAWAPTGDHWSGAQQADVTVH